jgi:eukaryotic-like serine/threonine-protein kinase
MDHVAQLSNALSGRYAIEREIGRGGMATVYLARDLRHDRHVALKVLDPELGAVLGAERFLAEIRVTANLQHPNLLPLFDSGAAGGLLFYVMPFVEGESLRARLERERQLPVPEALRIAREVAGALDYAHRHGVIHRDIKPENILLHDGRAMVADFGIALAVANAGAQRMTQTGLSLGTPQYMSPEQAMGEKTIDARADIYALGAVTYEMLTGDPPFTGSSVQAIVAKVLSERPTPIRTLRDSVTPAVERAVLTALAKLPADRFSTAKDLADALDAKVPIEEPAAVLPSPRVRRNPIVVSLAAALVITTAFAMRPLFTHATEPDAVVRFSIELPRYVSAGNSIGPGVALSHDGRMVAYIAGAADAAPQQVMVRVMDDPHARPLAGTEAAQSVFVSPDGKAVGFWTKGRVSRVSLDGGAPLTLWSSIGGFNGACWTSKGQIVATEDAHLVTIPESGGQITRVPNDSAGRVERYPVCLEDGETVLVVSGVDSPTLRSTLTAVSLRDGRRTPLGIAGSAALGVVDGYLVYATSGHQLMAVALDTRSLRVRGTPVQVGAVSQFSSSIIPAAALSPAGTLVYASGSTSATLVHVDTRGVAHQIEVAPQPYGNPRFSPDGKRVAFAISEGIASRVWLYDLAAQTQQQFTDGVGDRPEWSADGRRVIYRGGGTTQTARSVLSTLWWRPIDGSEPATPVFASADSGLWEGVMAPDNRGFIVQRDLSSTERGADIVYRGVGDSTFRAVAATPAEETQGRPSPDGKWVALQSAAVGGASHVIVKSFTGGGAAVVVSPGFGTEPVWSRDGKHLYYRDGQQFVDVTYESSPDFRIVARTPLFTDVYLFSSVPHANYDAYPDGSGFLALRATEGRRFVVAHHWREELHRTLQSSSRR